MNQDRLNADELYKSLGGLGGQSRKHEAPVPISVNASAQRPCTGSTFIQQFAWGTVSGTGRHRAHAYS